MAIVKQIDGVWVALTGVQTLQRMASTRTVTYADGRPPEQEDCEPYPVDEQVNISVVARLAGEGIWGAADLAAYGLVIVADFAPPEGKQATGAPRYVQSGQTVVEEYDVEDIPPPPPPPSAADKLGAAGLTVDDLRELLGLGE